MKKYLRKMVERARALGSATDNDNVSLCRELFCRGKSLFDDADIVF